MEVKVNLEEIRDFSIQIGSDLIGRAVLSIHDLDPYQIETVTRDNEFWGSKAWFSCLEDMPDTDIFYLVVENVQGRMWALLPCQYIQDEKPLLFYNIPRMVADGGNFGNIEALTAGEMEYLAALQSKLQEHKKAMYPSLVAASPSSYCALSIDPSLQEEKQQEVILALVELLERVADKLQCVNRGFLYVREDMVSFLDQTLIPRGYTKAVLGADCILPVLWDDFEEYLQIFSSKRRVNIRRERKRFSDAGIRVQTLSGAQALTPELFDLQLALRKKHGINGNPEELRKRYKAMKNNLNENILLFQAIKENRIIGFVLYFQYNNSLYSYVAGFDYEQQERDFCYFNLVIYEPLIWAIRHGIKRIHFGLTAYEAKLRRGCALKDLTGYFSFQGKNSFLAVEAIKWYSQSEKQSLDAFREMVHPIVAEYVKQSL